MNNAFPSHDIDPKLKNSDWILKYIRAAWDEYSTGNYKMFYAQRMRYAEIMDYVLGKQSTDQYKKQVLNDESGDSSWINIDWSPRPVASKLIDIAIAKVEQRNFNIVATAIDVLAKDETETYYTKHKARIQAKEAAMQVNPELANNPALMAEPGDPQDMEELDMMMDLGVKLKVAMEAEMGIDYVLYKNNFKQLRRENLVKIFAFGPGGYKDYVDENGEVQVRGVDPAAVVISPCKRNDFSDGRYIGEVTDVLIGDLPFDAETRRSIAQSANNRSFGWEQAGRNGTPWDSEKVQVLDMEFLTYNDRVYERRENSSGGEVFRRARYEKKGKATMVTIEGKEVNKYVAKPVQVLMKGKWIVGTDYIYDAGQATYQKRSKPNKALVFGSYHLYATSFHKMRCASMMDRLIPIIDEYHNTLYKVQHFKNKWVPYIINIDIQAMEQVALGAGGKPMEPKEILQLVFQNFTALGRRMDVHGNLQNYKMVDIEPTGMAQEYTVLANDLARLLQEMRDVVGLNDLTDGSTPGERTLNYVASLGEQATNNALYPLMTADRALTESLAKGVILRLVQTVQERDVEGVIRTLGDETVKFIRVTKDIADRVWDIKLEDRPTDAQREQLIQELNGKDAQGLITPADKLLIYEVQNLKQARALLAKRIEKREKDAQQQKMLEIKANADSQQQSSIVAEEEKRKTLQLEYDLKFQLEDKLLDKQILLVEKKAEAQHHATDMNAATKIATEGMRQQAAQEQPSAATVE